MKVIGILLLASVLISTVAFISLAKDNTVVATKTYQAIDTINLRSRPNASSKILGSVQKGEIVQVSSIENGWAKVQLNSMTAYVNSSNLQEDSKGKTFNLISQITYMNSLIVIIVLMCLSVPYMLFRMFNQKVYRLTTIQEMRESANHPENLKEQALAGVSIENDRNVLAEDYLEKAYKSWSVVDSDAKTEYRQPSSKIEFNMSHEWIRKALRLCPTDEGVIERMNELGNIGINANLQRHWDGSRLFVGLWVILFAAASAQFLKESISLQNAFSIIFLFGIIAFLVLTHYAPAWRINTKKTNLSLTRFMADAGSGISGNFTVTRFKNGSTSHDATGAKAALGLIVIGIAIDFFFLPIKAIYCFVRNYVLS